MGGSKSNEQIIIPLSSVILIADNSGILRSMIKRILHSAGFISAFEAADGKQVLDLLMEHKVDLIISGINMPKVNFAFADYKSPGDPGIGWGNRLTGVLFLCRCRV